MFHVALYQPEIPPNTGSIIRLCANIGCMLHVIHPIGFDFDDKKLRRAGLDYHEFASVAHYTNYREFLNKRMPARIFACSTKGATCYTKLRYQPDDVFLFGPETRGLPLDILSSSNVEQVIRLPMQASSRSLNLSNATAIILYEAWRQLEFTGSSGVGTNG